MNDFIVQLSKINSYETNWLCEQLKKNIDLVEISYGYQDLCDYDGNILSAIDCAMFEAYCYYKNNTLISLDHALLLKNRDGIIGYNYIYDKPVILTVKQLIKLYEGNDEFHDWLCKLSKIDYYL